MRAVTTGFIAAAIAWVVPVSSQTPQATENVAAFARLYGVVRYFYPSDAASSIDWNRFAVHGVRRVRDAKDPGQLATSLQQLMRPLGPGIEVGRNLPPAPVAGTADARLVAWRYLGAGMSGSGGRGPYAAKRTNRAVVRSSSIDGFVTVMQNLPAQDLRGRTLRLRGQVRASSKDGNASSALWLRVDRPNQQMGFFDNMSNRPIRDPDWREYSIEGTVDGDATNVAFGVMASGAVIADFDAIELAARETDGRWTVLPIKDAGFEAPAGNGAGEWMRAGTSADAAITRSADKAPEGRQFLRFAPGSTAPPVDTELFESAPAAAGAHVDVDLGSGLKARVPLALSDADARGGSDSSALDALRAALGNIGDAGDPPDIDSRLADVIVAWNVFQHFYPYWEEARVDWNARLGPQLALASAAGTRSAQRDALRQLVADARDGHGSVNEPGGSGSVGMPLRFGLFDNQLVIVASGSSTAPVGAVVTTIDGTPSSQRMTQLIELASGSRQWKQVRALRELASCRKGAIVNLVVDDGSGPRPTSVTCDGSQPPAEKRPEPITELTSGVWYVDLTRAAGAQVKQALPKLATASGVVFDLRGYPTDAGAQVLPHLMDAPEGDRWMHVAKIVGPFGRFDGWQSFGWDMKPATPRVAGKIVFLTDERAISYAESVMGYVADRKLGTIVGGTTAGTNGNVATFVVPSGFTVAFTGMRVTGHDGRTPYHLVGVRPDLPVAPTLAAIRAGRDEVLERAISLIVEPGKKQ
jgi:hypothetical protein